MVNDVLRHAADKEQRFVEDLKAFLRIPSISAQQSGITECVSWLSNHLTAMGVHTRVYQTSGNPVLVGEIRGSSPKTLLFYGHYDVQPPDPIEKWAHPPFAAEEAVEDDGSKRIYARGAVDDKGNFFCIVKALQSYLETRGALPCTVKLIIEGEEEIGSPSLEGFIREHLDLLQADDMVWFDGGIHADGRPEVCLGMKGMLYVELFATSNPRDLHSGKAPLVDNAAWRLTWALNSLLGADGRVAIPGFYDDVLPPSERDLALIARAGQTRAGILRDWGIDHLRRDLEQSLSGRKNVAQTNVAQSSGVEADGDPLEGAALLRRLFFEPTCTICGISSGYTGPGSKTVIPATASAKVDFRLVPSQDPEDILRKLRAHLVATGFDDIEVKADSLMRASKSPSDAPVVDLVIDIMRANYGEPVVKPIVEGSGPGYAFELLGIPYVFSRLGPPEDRSHAPNEYTTRDAFRRGIATVIQLLAAYGGR